MDYVNFENCEVDSHYECMINLDKLNYDADVKQQAFNYMDQLEGWCSKQKASILMDLIFMIKPETIVEIGVFGGKSLVPMAYALQINKTGKIIGIDPWSHTASTEGMDGVNEEWWGKLDHEKILKGLQQKIAQFGLKDQIILLRTSSENAPLVESIDMLHIDGNHSEKTSWIDATKWIPQVRRGGIVIFDDITWATQKRAVEYVDEHCIKIAEFRGDNVWGIWIKK